MCEKATASLTFDGTERKPSDPDLQISMDYRSQLQTDMNCWMNASNVAPRNKTDEKIPALLRNLQPVFQLGRQLLHRMDYMGI